jgi:integrase
MLGQALKLALRKRIVSRIPYIRKLEEFNVRRDFLEPWEVEKVVALLPDYLQDYVRFAHISSWRKGEISGLTWDDVQTTAIRLGSEQNKTGNTKMLPIDQELQELLERRRKLQIDGCPYVFHRKGEYIRDFRKAWNKAIAVAGYQGRVFHCLRRSGVRAMIRAGVPDTVAMSISGHKTRAMLDRYNISSENDILVALQKTRDYRLSQTLSQGSQ